MTLKRYKVSMEVQLRESEEDELPEEEFLRQLLKDETFGADINNGVVQNISIKEIRK